MVPIQIWVETPGIVWELWTKTKLTGALPAMEPLSTFVELKAMMNSLWSKIGEPCVAPVIHSYFGEGSDVADTRIMSQIDRKADDDKIEKKAYQANKPHISDVIPHHVRAGDYVSVNVSNKGCYGNLAIFVNGVWCADVPNQRRSLVTFRLPKLSAHSKEAVLSLEYTDIGLELDAFKLSYDPQGSDMDRHDKKCEAPTSPTETPAFVEKLHSLDAKNVEYESQLDELYEQYWGILAHP